MLPCFGNAQEDRVEGVILNAHADFKPSSLTDYNFALFGNYSSVHAGASYYIEKEAEHTPGYLLQPIIVSSHVPPGTISQVAKETGRIIVRDGEDKEDKKQQQQVGRGEEVTAFSFLHM